MLIFVFVCVSFNPFIKNEMRVINVKSLSSINQCFVEFQLFFLRAEKLIKMLIFDHTDDFLLFYRSLPTAVSLFLSISPSINFRSKNARTTQQKRTK